MCAKNRTHAVYFKYNHLWVKVKHNELVLINFAAHICSCLHWHNICILQLNYTVSLDY